MATDSGDGQRDTQTPRGNEGGGHYAPEDHAPKFSQAQVNAMIADEKRQRRDAQAKIAALEENQQRQVEQWKKEGRAEAEGDWKRERAELLLSTELRFAGADPDFVPAITAKLGDVAGLDDEKLRERIGAFKIENAKFFPSGNGATPADAGEDGGKPGAGGHPNSDTQTAGKRTQVKASDFQDLTRAKELRKQLAEGKIEVLPG